MNKFRAKLIDWKQRLQDRKMYSVVIVIIGLVAIWGFYQYRQASQYRQLMENTYNRAFVDMVGYVDNVEVLLAKSLATSSHERTAATMQEAWRQANMAQENLSLLPIDQPVLGSTSKFLTQVGDYANSMNQLSMYRQDITEEQYKTLQKLHQFAVSLGDSLGRLNQQVAMGRLKWGWIQKKGRIAFANADKDAAIKQIESVDKTFQKYPTLIYDGPFSDHMTNRKPQAITGSDVTVEQAKQAAIDFIGEDLIDTITADGNNNGENTNNYTFNVTYRGEGNQGSGMIELTKKGGHVMMYMRDRPEGSKTMEVEQAINLAKDFLDSRDFKNMKDTYYMMEGNSVIINFAYVDQGVQIYSDLIKVKVAMDTGECLGFESKGYLYNHKERKLPKPVFTPEKAKALINKRVKIIKVQTVMIPTLYGTETFCQEIYGTVNEERVLIYINCENGREENILMLLESDDGTMTM